MKYLLTALSSVLLALSALAAAPDLRWTVDTSKSSKADWQFYQGESLPLAPAFVSYGFPVALSGASATFLWQTNGMGTSWWSKAASVVTGNPDRVSAVWHPTNDCGAASYSYFIRVSLPSATLYRAEGTIKMLRSPGFAPAVLPPPAVWPDLAASLAPLVAPLISANLTRATNYTDAATNRLAQAITNEAALRAASDIHLQQQVTLLAESGSITGEVGTAAMSDSALRLASADSNWWITVESGTATLWRVTAAPDTNAAAASFSADAADPTGAPCPWAGQTVVMPITRDGDWRSFAADSGAWSVGGNINSEGRWQVTCQNGGAWTWFSNDFVPPVSLSAIDYGAGSPAGIVAITYAMTARDTNAVGSYVTAAALAAALSSYVSADATNALALASNAWALASGADARLSTATNALFRALISTNAWIEANASSNTISVYVVSTNGTNVVTIGGVAGIDPAATNQLWIALAAGLSEKSPKAWGSYAPDGTANPDPSYMTWLNAPATVFASGACWSTYGTWAVITSPGSTAFETGGNGMLRIGPDATNYFGYAVGGSVTVGAVPNSIHVYGGGTSNGIAEIAYQYAGGDFPVIWFTPALSVGFTQLSASWIDNLDGTATCTVPATAAGGFFRASTSATYSSFFVTSMPARFINGVIGSTNAAPVIYNSTVNVLGTDGHTYRIPARFVE